MDRADRNKQQREQLDALVDRLAETFDARAALRRANAESMGRHHEQPATLGKIRRRNIRSD